MLRAVHVLPLGLVTTRLPVPVFATAQNKPNSGDQHTMRQVFNGILPSAHVIPSELVAERLTVPVDETPQNKPNSEDQHTEIQATPLAEDNVPSLAKLLLKI